MATTNVTSNPVIPKSHVGFDSITNQIERKLLKRGFQFNVICVGRFKLVWNRFSPTDSPARPDRFGEINPDKYHLRLPSYRL